LTGNIATGKSEVARMLAEWGAQVIDADRVAHQVMQPNGPAYDQVVEAFGSEILSPDGQIDRGVLGDLVFRDAGALHRLEAAVHPATIAAVAQRITETTAAIVVVEAIKLIESGMHHAYDTLWVVTAPRALQIRRLVSERGLAPEQAVLRVDAQPPQEEKVRLADRVFVNDGDLEQLREKVRGAWTEIQRIAAR
jgi:dephospho-CoA kinase